MSPAYFDNYALEYDAHFTGSLIGTAQRKIVHSVLEETLSMDSNVLELNCGTGEDALFIAPRCREILCTDISEEMVKLASLKTQMFLNCKVITSSIQQLDHDTTKKFNFIFSNFGGLNCLNEHEMKDFAELSADATSPGADVILVVMGRKCIWEKLYFTFKRDSGRALRRKQSFADAVINGSEFKVYYYSPAELEKFFSPSYKLILKKPVGFFIPPSYLNSFFQRHKFLFAMLCFFEKLASRLPFLSDYSDHYLLYYKRK